MLCCFDVPSKYSPVDGNGSNNNTHSFGGSYPGQRRPIQYQDQPPAESLYPTYGNALQGQPMQQQHQQQEESIPFAQPGGGGVDNDDMPIAGPPTSKNGHTVDVKIPMGVVAGQTLNVNATDGSGRVIAATVPEGMEPGSTFQVTFPSDDGGDDGTPIATSAPPQQQQQQEIPVAPPGQKLMLVQVPDGVSAGQSIQVRVPGENQILAVVVPGNGVKQFYAAYTPQQQQQQQAYGTPNSKPNKTDSNSGWVAPAIAGGAGAAMLAGTAALILGNAGGDE